MVINQTSKALKRSDVKSNFVGLRLNDNDLLAAGSLVTKLGFRNIQDMLRWLLSVGFRAFHGGVWNDDAEIALLFLRAYKSDRTAAIELCRRTHFFKLRLPEADEPKLDVGDEIREMFEENESLWSKAFPADINKRL